MLYQPMKKLLSATLAGNLLIGLLMFLAMVHVLVLFRIVPSDVVFGRQNDGEYLSPFTFGSLFMIAIFVSAVALKTRSLKFEKPASRIVDTSLWILLVYASLILGSNLVSRSAVENVYLTPFTVILIFLVYRLTAEE